MSKRAVAWAVPLAAVIAVVAVVIGWPQREPSPPVVSAPPAWVDEASCQGCHARQVGDWLGSHHQLAMQPATADTVLADFNDQSLASDVETTRFFRRGDDFWINTSNQDGEPRDYRVAFTFGVEPLQQYLIRLPDGRLQVHPAAWDVREKRWFHLYDGDAVDHHHALHWSGAQQNADFMCIECHVSGFARDYDPATNAYASRWQAPGVGCQSCHGPASGHLQWAKDGQPEMPAKGFEPVAGEPESCGRCHSRRTPLGNGYAHENALLDDYLPMMLSAELYEVDGKIKGEVFEYGSFRQSRMHAAGVVCLDCHNPHSTELRAPGNAVCTQCHNPEATPRRSGIDAGALLAKDYDDPSHHHHPAGSPGSECASCHMPGKVYMGIDLRHDHSFTSPNPAEARALSHSDACLSCHEDSAEEFLLTRFAQWYPNAQPRDGGYARALHAARNGTAGAAEKLLAQLARADLADIRRATLLNELVNFPSIDAQRALIGALADGSALVRRTAVELLPALLSTRHQQTVLQALRNDPVRAVRLAVAWQLLQLPPEPGVDRRELIAEYEQSQNTMLDRAEAHFNLAGVYQLTGREAQVGPALRRALQQEAAFHPARIMLAQWLEQAENDFTAARQLLGEGIDRWPEDASLRHALGLMLVRQGLKDDAVQVFRDARERAPEQADYGYVLAVALHGQGETGRAIQLLDELLESNPANRTLRMALVSYLRAEGREAEADSLLAALAAINPRDPLLRTRRH